MKPVLKVVIAEPSLIIRKGLLTVLKKLSTLNIEAAEVADMQQLPALLSWRRPDILIIDPGLAGISSIIQFKKSLEGLSLKCIALQHSLADASVLKCMMESSRCTLRQSRLRQRLNRWCRLLLKKKNDKNRSPREKKRLL